MSDVKNYALLTCVRGDLHDATLHLAQSHDHHENSCDCRRCDSNIIRVEEYNIKAALEAASIIKALMSASAVQVDTTVVFRAPCAGYFFATMTGIRVLRIGAALPTHAWADFLSNATFPCLQSFQAIELLPAGPMVSFTHRHNDTLEYIAYNIDIDSSGCFGEPFDMPKLKEMKGTHGSVSFLAHHFRCTPAMQHISFEPCGHITLPSLEDQLETIARFAFSLVEAKLVLCTTNDHNINFLTGRSGSTQSLVCFNQLVAIELHKTCCDDDRDNCVLMVSYTMV